MQLRFSRRRSLAQPLLVMGRMKPAAPTEFTGGLANEQPAAAATGLAAQLEAVDRTEGQTDSPAFRAAPREARPAAPPDPASEPLQKLILREAARLRQQASGSMSIVLCVDERTELLVHFTQRDDGIDASARCEPADAARLGALWPRLQQALAPRHIRLAPLRSAAERGPGAAPSLGVFHSGERGSRSNAPVTRPDWETWA